MKALSIVGMSLVLIGSQTRVYADTLTWTNKAGGSFQEAVNWSPNKAPGGLDTAQFNTSSSNPYTVTLNANVNVTNVTLPSGTFALTLDLNGYSLTSASNGITYLGSSAGSAIDWTVKSSAPGGVFNLYQMSFLSTVSNACGTVNITGSNTSVNVAQGSTVDNMVFNLTTNGTFLVSDGAHLMFKKYVQFGIGTYQWGLGAPAASPTAKLIITDPGTTCTNLNAFLIGKAGDNMPTMVVSNGAMCKALSFNIGLGGDTWYSYSPRSNGKLVVTGTNSYCEATVISMANLAGQYGTPGSTAGGYVVVEKGGVLKCLTSVATSLGLIHYYPTTRVNPGSVTNLNAYGEVVVRNPGSSLSVATYIRLAVLGKGALYVLDGATLTTPEAGVLEMSYGLVGSYPTYDGASMPDLTNDNAYGLCVISNANSSATFNRVEFGTVAGYGDLIVADNARLDVTNGTSAYIKLSPRSTLTVSDAFVQTPTLTVVSNSTIRVALGARDHASAYIQVSNVTVNADARLEVGVLGNAAHNPGDTIALLKYTGTLTGTFKDLPEGAVLLTNGRRFKINYGDGSNDTLTLKYAPSGTLLQMR